MAGNPPRLERILTITGLRAAFLVEASLEEAMPRVRAPFRSKALLQRSGEASSLYKRFLWERTCR
ncbi:hypothetical protein GCM10022419_133620 [Nonomuraea rosea]|uniref:Uncharacterized protein n=1 Tax=Nonomuraea rosea TaxID=638574 RepID=A0ABP7A5U6_9ACTN